MAFLFDLARAARRLRSSAGHTLLGSLLFGVSPNDWVSYTAWRGFSSRPRWWQA